MREDMPIIRVNLSFHNNTDCETLVNIWIYIISPLGNEKTRKRIEVSQKNE